MMVDLDENQIAEHHREAAILTPNVDVSLESFSKAVTAALQTNNATTLETLHTQDLYLAVGCLEKIPHAIAKLEKEFIGAVRPSVERVCRDGISSVDDVMQWTREKLLVGDSSTSPKLTQYTGRGPLLGWVRVVALREALQSRRKSKRERSRDDAAMLEGANPDVSIELGVLRQRYASSFRTSVEAAIRCLTPEQRRLLRFHTHDGLTIDQLAPMLGVHRATVARRLETARADALEHTRRIIREKHGLSESEARSLCTALASEVDISIGRALTDEVST